MLSLINKKEYLLMFLQACSMPVKYIFGCMTLNGKCPIPWKSIPFSPNFEVSIQKYSYFAASLEISTKT